MILQTSRAKLPVGLVDAKYKTGDLMILPIFLALAFLISSSCSSYEVVPANPEDDSTFEPYTRR
jgi:hypothetical protein